MQIMKPLYDLTSAIFIKRFFLEIFFRTSMFRYVADLRVIIQHFQPFSSSKAKLHSTILYFIFR